MAQRRNRQIVLRQRPNGLVAPADVELIDTPVPDLADGEALLRTTYIGMDAAARTWLDDQPGYLPPVQIGEVIRAAGIGEVVESRCPAYAVGDVVTTLTGFAAAGATGSVAGQIAKIAGARVIGIAGGPDKCRFVVENFGFDACIDYKRGELAADLKQHAPHGVNVYFDNVGGPVLNAVLGRLATRARVVLCGVISSYLTGDHPGPANYVNLLSRTALMQGFNALDEWGRFEEAYAALRGWEEQGLLVHHETVLDGLESCPDALNGLFTGANIGKMLVKVSAPSS